MKPRDSLTSMSLRVKKYFIATTWASSETIEFAFSSNGRRIDTPSDILVPAPSAAACMIPGPAPVTTIQPSAASAAATSRAWKYSGSSGSVRADPNTVTFGT